MLETDPTDHSVQALTPSSDDYLPASHATQSTLFVSYFPMEHGLHAEDASLEIYPAMHKVHDESPSSE